MNKTLQLLTLLAVLMTHTGCGLLLGNVRPVEERSDSYGIMDLSQSSSDWTRLNKSSEPNNNFGISDVAFQSKKTAAIISLNSACRPTIETREPALKELTDELLLGIHDISLREEKELVLQKIPALQTTVKGVMGQAPGEPMMLRTVVLRKETCVFDLMYVARPESFASQEQTFAQFVDSLRLKD